jgi:hypothetical protein
MDVAKYENPFCDALEEALGTAFETVFDHHLEIIKKMKEENEKEEKNSEGAFYNAIHEALETAFETVFDHHLEIIKKMKEENEKQEKNSTPVNSSMDSTMDENAFFDALDGVFGTDDGYVHHLERIKKMKEENEKLKEENELWRKQQPAYQEQTTLNEYKKTAEEEIKKLKKENEELSATAELIDDIQMAQQKREEEWKHDYKVAEMRKEKIEEVMGENEKLKNTIVSLKSSVDDLREARDKRDHQIKELKEENKNRENLIYKELYEQGQKHMKTQTEYEECMIKYIETASELKEALEKLKQ